MILPLCLQKYRFLLFITGLLVFISCDITASDDFKDEAKEEEKNDDHSSTLLGKNMGDICLLQDDVVVRCTSKKIIIMKGERFVKEILNEDFINHLTPHPDKSSFAYAVGEHIYMRDTQGKIISHYKVQGSIHSLIFSLDGACLFVSGDKKIVPILLRPLQQEDPMYLRWFIRCACKGDIVRFSPKKALSFLHQAFEQSTYDEKLAKRDPIFKGAMDSFKVILNPHPSYFWFLHLSCCNALLPEISQSGTERLIYFSPKGDLIVGHSLYPSIPLLIWSAESGFSEISTNIISGTINLYNKRWNKMSSIKVMCSWKPNITFSWELAKVVNVSIAPNEKHIVLALPNSLRLYSIDQDNQIKFLHMLCLVGNYYTKVKWVDNEHIVAYGSSGVSLYNIGMQDLFLMQKTPCAPSTCCDVICQADGMLSYVTSDARIHTYQPNLPTTSWYKIPVLGGRICDSNLILWNRNTAWVVGKKDQKRQWEKKFDVPIKGASLSNDPFVVAVRDENNDIHIYRKDHKDTLYDIREPIVYMHFVAKDKLVLSTQNNQNSYVWEKEKPGMGSIIAKKIHPRKTCGVSSIQKFFNHNIAEYTMSPDGYCLLSSPTATLPCVMVLSLHFYFEYDEDSESYKRSFSHEIFEIKLKEGHLASKGFWFSDGDYFAVVRNLYNKPLLGTHISIAKTKQWYVKERLKNQLPGAVVNLLLSYLVDSCVPAFGQTKNFKLPLAFQLVDCPFQGDEFLMVNTNDSSVALLQYSEESGMQRTWGHHTNEINDSEHDSFTISDSCASYTTSPIGSITA